MHTTRQVVCENRVGWGVKNGVMVVAKVVCENGWVHCPGNLLFFRHKETVWQSQGDHVAWIHKPMLHGSQVAVFSGLLVSHVLVG